MGRNTKRSQKQTIADFVLFDVLYEDGTRSSNRRVPGTDLAGPEGDEPARAIIEEQDRKIGEMSGKPKAPIKSLSRTPVR